MDVINEAALRQMAHVRAYQLGPQAALSQRILNEISQARTVLLSAEKRKAYDATLAPVANAGPPRLAGAISKPSALPARQRSRYDEADEPEDVEPPRRRDVPSVRKPARPFPLLLILGLGGGAAALAVVIVGVTVALWLLRSQQPAVPLPLAQGPVEKPADQVVEMAKGRDMPAQPPVAASGGKPPEPPAVVAPDAGPRLVKGAAVPGNVAAFLDAQRFLTFTGPTIKLRSQADPTGSLASFDGHGEDILDVTLSRDGKRLASTDRSKQIFVWDVDTRAILQKIPTTETINCIAFSPDGRKLAGGGKRDVYLWDVPAGSALATYTGQRGGETIRQVAFTPDGNQVASGGQTFRVWDLRTNETTAQAPPLGGRMSFAVAGQGGIYYLATSYNHLYRKTAQTMKQLNDTPRHLLFVSFAPDGQSLLVGGPTFVGLAEPDTGALLSTLDLGPGEWQPVVGATNRTVAAVDRGRVISYLIEIKQENLPYKGHSELGLKNRAVGCESPNKNLNHRVTENTEKHREPVPKKHAVSVDLSIRI